MRAEALNTWTKVLSIISLCFIYYWLGYELERSQFWLLFSLYTAAFGLSFYLYKSGIRLSYLILLSFLLKFIFLFSIPELSQDFYRFVWDGMLYNQGINPYLHLPKELVESHTIEMEDFQGLLYDRMGDLNASNYSTYPPVAQLIYTLSYAIGQSSLILNIIVLRLFNITAEIGIVWFGLKILPHLKLPKSQILFFILNPLVILESTFNLHFEAVMLFFLALSLYYLCTSKVYLSALGLAGAVASKMLPLMFLPLLFPYFNKKLKVLNRDQILNYLKYIALLMLGLIISYSFFWNPEILSKSSKTLSLYFTSFEFNASIYYVLREIGYWWTGYNQIEIIGISLTIVTLLSILFLSFRHRRIDFQTLMTYMLFAATAYYLLSTTVHPWYLMLPLFLSIFTTYKYMLMWSWLVFLSYSAYNSYGVEENYLLLIIEYIIVIGMILLELRKRNKWNYLEV